LFFEIFINTQLEWGGRLHQLSPLIMNSVVLLAVSDGFGFTLWDGINEYF
jgi:hypothetical protein